MLPVLIQRQKTVAAEEKIKIKDTNERKNP